VWHCDENDLTNADVAEVLRWAQERAPSHGAYTIFVEATNNRNRGFPRIAGWYPTRQDATPPHVR
jgi:hypothetical protein